MMAGVCENRTHQGREYRPTTGFEDQEHHQALSTPITKFILYKKYSFLSRGTPPQKSYGEGLNFERKD